MDLLSLAFSWPLLATAAAVLGYYCLARRDSRLPPGPTGWPIVGYIPFLKNEPHLDFIGLAKVYGKVFSLRLGPNDAIM